MPNKVTRHQETKTSENKAEQPQLTTTFYQAWKFYFSQNFRNKFYPKSKFSDKVPEIMATITDPDRSDYYIPTYTQSRAKVPTYKLDTAKVYSAQRSKLLEAHPFLSYHDHMSDDEAEDVLNQKELDNIRKALAETEVIEGWFDPDLIEGRFRSEESFYRDTAGNDSGEETSPYEISGTSALQKESLEEEMGKPMDDSSSDVVVEYEILLGDEKKEPQGVKPEKVDVSSQHKHMHITAPIVDIEDMQMCSCTGPCPIDLYIPLATSSLRHGVNILTMEDGEERENMETQGNGGEDTQGNGGD